MTSGGHPPSVRAGALRRFGARGPGHPIILRPDGRATMKKPFAIAATAAGLVLAQTALAQTDDTKLGKVHFETSCKPEAQKHFDRAMLYQHSFWYRASQMAFEDVLRADPECAMAH